MTSIFIVVYGENYEQHIDDVFTVEEDAHERAQVLAVTDHVQFAEVIKREIK